jgi:DNA repair protein RecN (Recombination protein N)
MLQSLAIRNHSLIESLDLDLKGGLTVITGETGAGKSIVLEALGLALGDRADSRALRTGASRMEVSAGFDIGAVPAAAAWLAERALEQQGECWLRRVVGADGRSRAWINGQPATLADLASLSAMLVDAHGQHEHHALLARATQQGLLDEYGGHAARVEAVRGAHATWQACRAELAGLEAGAREREDRRQLLEYQLGELRELALAEGEVEQLERDQRLLANAGELRRQAETLHALCADEDDGGILGPLRHAATLAAGLAELGARAGGVRELLESASIQVDEARRELARLGAEIEVDPGRLAEVELRLDAALRIARKHRVAPAGLAALTGSLEAEAAAISGADSRIGELRERVAALAREWREHAAALTAARREAAQGIVARVREQLAELGMAACRFEVVLRPVESSEPAPGGAEQIEFLVSTNPGAAPGPLARIASGGELSRISLAIQVVTASRATTPTVIFDEVDVGIGGATAEAVGRLLQELGERTQVICVTHLAQVAARGRQHLRAEKRTTGDSTSAALVPLDARERVEEIARMLGGRTITAKTRAHAREMLDGAQLAEAG